MEINAKHRERIEEIMGSMKCSKDFECYSSEFSNVCEIKDIGMDTFVECLKKENAEGCSFSFHFGYKYLCKCPLRVYIAKNLRK